MSIYAGFQWHRRMMFRQASSAVLHLQICRHQALVCTGSTCAAWCTLFACLPQAAVQTCCAPFSLAMHIRLHFTDEDIGNAKLWYRLLCLHYRMSRMLNVLHAVVRPDGICRCAAPSSGPCSLYMPTPSSLGWRPALSILRQAEASPACMISLQERTAAQW